LEVFSGVLEVFSGVLEVFYEHFQGFWRCFQGVYMRPEKWEKWGEMSENGGFSGGLYET
jgi:hypothetical protein